MKKIALLSDTHSRLDETAYKYFQDVDEIWHAGDIGSIQIVEKLQALKTLRAVYGNIDGMEIRKIFPEDLFFEIEGMKIFMTHIAGAAGKYSPRVKKLLQEHKPQLLICGHSHILKVMHDRENNVMYMNPGAAGNEGFHKMKTMLLFSIENAKLLDLKVVELGKRGALS